MPAIILSLQTNSWRIFPGNTRSGQYEIRISDFFPWVWGKLKSGRAFDNHSDIFSVVPTGEVDSKTIRFPDFRTEAIDHIDDKEAATDYNDLEDKDLDNDGDTGSAEDKYLHKSL